MDQNPDRDIAAELDARIERYARFTHHILITGERGTGKTTMARRIHRTSPRSRSEFVNLNCAGFSEHLLEAELFGYERGAFTGAAAAKAGLFEVAGGGTLFLDEVGDLPPLLQAKLLKAVEEKAIRRVGGNSERAVDVRVIAATSRDLLALVREGAFRADLYDRLNVLHIETIPLRAQSDRAFQVIETHLRREQPAVGRMTPFSFDAAARAHLRGHDWPGNYREAVNLATRIAVELAAEETITADQIRSLMNDNASHLNPELQASAETPQVGTRSGIGVVFGPDDIDLERLYLKAATTVIRSVLSEQGNSLRRAAKRMGTSHTTLSRILARHDETYALRRAAHTPPNAIA